MNLLNTEADLREINTIKPQELTLYAPTHFISITCETGDKSDTLLVKQNFEAANMGSREWYLSG